VLGSVISILLYVLFALVVLDRAELLALLSLVVALNS
jgi:hypothetical protein